VAAYTYHDANRLTGIGYNGTHPIYTVTYPTFDKVGNRMAKNDGTTVTYSYDLVYRLLNSSAGEAFTYDAVGNRLSDTAKQYAYNTGNQLTAAGSISFGYDATGNTTASNQWSYTWDAAGRMTSATDGTTLASFTYDPFGRRIGKTVNGVTTNYVYDNADIIASITNGAVTKFVHGLGADEHLALVQAGQPYFYHSDGLGSITRITDSGQVVVASYSYDAFANSTVTDTLCLNQPFTYTGRECDKETGLYYYRARYYDPMEGRFISRDPIAILGNIYNNFYNVTFNQHIESVKNSYTYVSNNPINYIDPDGLMMKKGVLVSIRNWLKKNITPKGMTDEAVDKIVGIIGLRTLTDDILDPKELGEGFDDEYMIRNFKHTKTNVCR
jgi:RHS repeat-associated protein